jgi:hypothetical protein
MTMNTTTKKCAIAIAIAGAMAIGAASPSWAASVPSNTAAVAAAAPNALTDVRYYRNRYRGGYRYYGVPVVGGLALGVFGAAAAAGGYYGDRVYDQPYGYAGAPYGYGYAPGYGYGSYNRQRNW